MKDLIDLIKAAGELKVEDLPKYLPKYSAHDIQDVAWRLADEGLLEITKNRTLKIPPEGYKGKYSSLDSVAE